MRVPVEIIGHRGAPRAYTENTIPSFRCALDGGADGLELDVHTTADGTVVVHHDARISAAYLGRREPGPAIAALTDAELMSLESERADRIPTLADVLMIAGKATVYVEIKAPHIERAVVETIRASDARCAVHSFDHRIARTVHELAPDLPVGILSSSYLLDPVGALRAAGARDYWQHVDLVDAELVGRVHDEGGRVIAWTVNDSVVAQSLVDIGVDGLCSDIAADLARLIR